MSRPGQRRRARAVLAALVLAAAPNALGYGRKLRRELIRFAPDIIHSNGLKMHFLALWARPFGTPLIWHVHDYVGQRSLLRNLFQKQVGLCSAVIANSNSVAADVRSLCGRQADQLDMQTVYNTVDLSEFSPSGTCADLDQVAGVAPPAGATVRIGLVATMAWWKGHRVFLDAIARLRPELPIRAYIVGGALYKTRDSQLSTEELRRYASYRGVMDRIAFTGYQADMASVYRSLDIVVHASTEPEPFGRVLIEAMSCGRPVITSGLGGAAEVVAAGKGPVTHRAGDASSLAEAMDMLASDPGLRRHLGEAGRKTVIAHFDRRQLADQLVPLYTRVRNVRVSSKLATAEVSS